VVEIPSGTQDGRAVEDLLRRMHLRPMAAAAAEKPGCPIGTAGSSRKKATV